MIPRFAQQPSFIYVAGAWAALLAGSCEYLVGLCDTGMQFNEKCYLFALLVYGLYSAIALQKTLRDRVEGIPVTGLYYGLNWVAFTLSILLLTVDLFNATLTLSEKGFYAMSFGLALLGAVAIQKNARDIQASRSGSLTAEPAFNARDPEAGH